MCNYTQGLKAGGINFKLALNKSVTVWGFEILNPPVTNPIDNPFEADTEGFISWQDGYIEGYKLSESIYKKVNS